MNNSVVEIKISGLPAIFPSADYTGKINTFYRVIATGTYSEMVKTEDAFRTIYDGNYQERKIQDVTYNKYKLRIPANEHLRADLIEHAKYAYVITQDDVRHKMKVLSVDNAMEDATELGEWTIEYADINPKNYKNQQIPINNYLEHNQIQEEFTTAQLQSLYYDYQPNPIYPAITYTFYTELLMEEDVMEMEEEKQPVNGVEKITRSIRPNIMRARFYLNSSDKNSLMRSLPWSPNAQLAGAHGNVGAAERVTPEVKQVGVNLWQIDITMKHDINIYYPENTL